MKRASKANISALTRTAEFGPPVVEARLRHVELDLGVSLPADLRELYGESDGVKGEYGLDLVWGIDRVASDNLAFRSDVSFHELYMPFDHLLFFGDAGNGDQFAYAICAGEIRRPDIFVWNHENDSRAWVAPDLARYFEWWLSGRLTV